MSKLTNTSKTDLEGIVYFKDLPYDNEELNDMDKPYLDGALKLTKWASTLKIRVGASDANVLDIRDIDNTVMETYNIKQGDVYSYGGIRSIYFHSSIKDIARKDEKMNIDFYKQFVSENAGRINNEYFGDGDRQNSWNNDKEDSNYSIRKISSKKPRKLSEFEYYGIHNKFEDAAIDSYNNDFSGLSDMQKNELNADKYIKKIAKVTTLCPLC